MGQSFSSTYHRISLRGFLASTSRNGQGQARPVPGRSVPGYQYLGAPLAVVSPIPLRSGAAPGSLLMKALHGHRILDRSGIGIHMLFNFQQGGRSSKSTSTQALALLPCYPSIICICICIASLRPGAYHGIAFAIPASLLCPSYSAACGPFLYWSTATIAAVGLPAA